MHKSLVSVVVTTKNNETTLEDCLASIDRQDYGNIEIVVVDNFSSDRTVEIAKKHTKKVYSKGPERCAQRNYAASEANGKYLLIVDSDMKLSPAVISQCIETIARPGVSGVVVPEESFGEGFWAQCKKLERSFYVGVPYMEAARFFEKKLFLEAGAYDENLISGEDWDLSQRTEKLGKLARITAYIYHNEGRISLFKTVRKKYYYAQKFSTYMHKHKGSRDVGYQTEAFGRYILFLRHPLKLFKNPIVGLGMLFMKACEFGFGAAGLLIAKVKKST